jgi:hypothetical protein
LLLGLLLMMINSKQCGLWLLMLSTSMLIGLLHSWGSNRVMLGQLLWCGLLWCGLWLMPIGLLHSWGSSSLLLGQLLWCELLLWCWLLWCALHLCGLWLLMLSTSMLIG